MNEQSNFYSKAFRTWQGEGGSQVDKSLCLSLATVAKLLNFSRRNEVNTLLNVCDKKIFRIPIISNLITLIANLYSQKICHNLHLLRTMDGLRSLKTKSTTLRMTSSGRLRRDCGRSSSTTLMLSYHENT